MSGVWQGGVGVLNLSPRGRGEDGLKAGGSLGFTVCLSVCGGAAVAVSVTALLLLRRLSSNRWGWTMPAEEKHSPAW